MDLKDIFRKYIKDISKTHNNIPSSHHLLELFPKSTTFNNINTRNWNNILCPIWLPQSKPYIFAYMWMLAVKSNLCGCMLPKEKCKHQPRQKPFGSIMVSCPTQLGCWVKPNTTLLKTKTKWKP